MKQNKNEINSEVIGVEEYIEKRKMVRKEEIKKEQEKFPEPFSRYSSFLLMTL